jgi:hypothetical protein
MSKWAAVVVEETLGCMREELFPGVNADGLIEHLLPDAVVRARLMLCDNFSKAGIESTRSHYSIKTNKTSPKTKVFKAALKSEPVALGGKGRFYYGGDSGPNTVNDGVFNKLATRVCCYLLPGFMVGHNAESLNDV